MVIGIIGESCVGKSALAKKLKVKLNADVYTGKDYLRLAKNEADARKAFAALLQNAPDSGNVIYVISEKEHISLLPAEAFKILVTADLEVIEKRFAERMHGNLPLPVKQMPENRHGCFDNEECDIHVEGAEGDFELVYRKIMEVIMNFNIKKMLWTRKPKNYKINADSVEIITEPGTDLWQRTYYHFRNDNAPVLQMETEEKFFSFVVKTEFESKCRFDQCGIVMYLDSENWLKASVECENEQFQHLGSVVTNHGYSDWATECVDASINTMWYRFSRRNDDYCIECSGDGENFSQMRICHMWEGAGKIRFGIYACSPEDSSFKAVFTNMKVTECAWKPHDGQTPDEE